MGSCFVGLTGLEFAEYMRLASDLQHSSSFSGCQRCRREPLMSISCSPCLLWTVRLRMRGPLGLLLLSCSCSSLPASILSLFHFPPLSMCSWPASTPLLLSLSHSAFLYPNYPLNSSPHALNKLYSILKESFKKRMPLSTPIASCIL